MDAHVFVLLRVHLQPQPRACLGACGCTGLAQVHHARRAVHPCIHASMHPCIDAKRFFSAVSMRCARACSGIASPRMHMRVHVRLSAAMRVVRVVRVVRVCVSACSACYACQGYMLACAMYRYKGIPFPTSPCVSAYLRVCV